MTVVGNLLFLVRMVVFRFADDHLLDFRAAEALDLAERIRQRPVDAGLQKLGADHLAEPLLDADLARADLMDHRESPQNRRPEQHDREEGALHEAVKPGAGHLETELVVERQRNVPRRRPAP